VTVDHIYPMCFLSMVHILACNALILLPKPHTFRIWVSYMVSYA
jgi:hypothetical protein